ncbi:MAG: hypothetical protein JSV35_02135 [Candidatus Bathyarchaeota archaeon]|nr:MAG: hypothetical protein JSV35_02135 [Candidatus Bathyarchaeota archaeon]
MKLRHPKRSAWAFFTLFLLCFLTLSSAIEPCLSLKPVVVEFFIWIPCSACPDQQEAYEIWENNMQVINEIKSDYGQNVTVDSIPFGSEEGLQKLIDQYGIDPAEIEDYWNAIVVNYETMLKGYLNSTYLREIIDFCLQPVQDIAVLSIRSSSYSVLVGDEVQINVTVGNQGELNESFTLTLYVNSTILSTDSVIDLYPSTQLDVSFNWTTANEAVGVYVLSAEVSILENETDSSDNLLTSGVIEVREPDAAPKERHDVAVMNVKVSELSIRKGEEVNITITVENWGTGNETFNLNVYGNDTLIGELSISNLEPNQPVDLLFEWDTTEADIGQIVLKAEADQVVNETNLDNNIYILNDGIEIRESSTFASLALTALLAVSFSFGFFETFSPCLIILLSFVLSYTLGANPSFKESFLKVMIFGAGFVSAALLLGVAFGLFFLSLPALQLYLTLGVSVFAIVFGLNLLGVLKTPLETKPAIRKLAEKYVLTYPGLFLLGFIFYFLDPCIAPIFIAFIPLLMLDTLPIILAVFTLGAFIPFLAIGVFTGSVSKLVRLTYKQRFRIRAISGLVLIGYAIYLFAFYLFPSFT